MINNYIVLNDGRIVNLCNVMVIEKGLAYGQQNEPLYRIYYINQNGNKVKETFDTEESRNRKYSDIIEHLKK